MREQVSIDDVIAFLNELIALDNDAVVQTTLHRVACNQALADHPTVQVAPVYNEFGAEIQGAYTVGFTGLINGLFGVGERGQGSIRYVMQDGELVRFERNE
jgi:hypothetical protein